MPCLADGLGLFYIDRLPGFIIVCKQAFLNASAILAERFGSRYGFAAKGLGQTAQGRFSTLRIDNPPSLAQPNSLTSGGLNTLSKMAANLAAAVWWGGPPGLQPAPWPASCASSQRPTRASAADQGLRPTGSFSSSVARLGAWPLFQLSRIP